MVPDALQARPVSKPTLADVLRAALPAHSTRRQLPPHHWKTLRAILACRTPVLGGHHYRCTQCGHEHFVPHSCRNRHCPSCQGSNGADWMARQTELLLPIPYFHLVFTLPHTLNPLIAQNQAALYALLFEAASATLLEFGRHELGVQLGLTAVLHTWSQTLLDHYHLHCIVTGGGLSAGGRAWASTKGYWLLPVKALSKVFRAKFRDGLRERFAGGDLTFHGQCAPLAETTAFDALLKSACREPWVVYAKRPFAGPQTVLAYLARYTHRVGISNARLHQIDEAAHTMSFAYKDYADSSRRKRMTLSLEEFIRRFRLHILPPRFVKIRHYGFLSTRNRRAKVAIARALLAQTRQPRIATFVAHPRQSTLPPAQCPACGQPTLILVRVTRFAPAAPAFDSS